MFHLSEWDELGKLSMGIWGRLDKQQRESVAPMLVKASVDMQDWDAASEYAKYTRLDFEMQLFNLGAF